MTVPPYVILPPGGNGEWSVTTKKGIDKVKKKEYAGKAEDVLKDFPCPECGKVLRSAKAFKYHTTSPTACKS
jgi:predicted RNA-binding Zn-ribbon protein involved in translation (DUF1610 family)